MKPQPLTTEREETLRIVLCGRHAKDGDTYQLDVVKDGQALVATIDELRAENKLLREALAYCTSPRYVELVLAGRIKSTTKSAKA